MNGSDHDGPAILSVYPNPSPGIFIVQLGHIGTGMLRITDQLGNLIYKKEPLLGGSIETIDLTQFAKGIYFISLDYGGKKVMDKVVLE